MVEIGDSYSFGHEMYMLWDSLSEKQQWNFLSVYSILESNHRLYHQPAPVGVENSYWKKKVISGFAAQPFFNLPQIKKILYSGLISKKASAIHRSMRVKEHRYPRRAWLDWRLFSPIILVSFEEFFRLYWEEGGTYNITTKKENSLLENYYADKPDHYIQDGGELAYRSLGIELINEKNNID